jgi:hypothetical protein
MEQKQNQSFKPKTQTPEILYATSGHLPLDTK